MAARIASKLDFVQKKPAHLPGQVLADSPGQRSPEVLLVLLFFLIRGSRASLFQSKLSGPPTALINRGRKQEGGASRQGQERELLLAHAATSAEKAVGGVPCALR
eukprot:9480546-Pyramimonas_sp.AAC.1